MTPSSTSSTGLATSLRSRSLQEYFRRRELCPPGRGADGALLFDRLLGAPAWQAIRAAAGAGADVIELALRFDGRYDLHRFPWELMHGPTAFWLRACPSASVTRLVARSAAAAAAAPASAPPAAALRGRRQPDRPKPPAGAEILGLLRQLNARGMNVNTRVLRDAAPKELRDAVRAVPARPGTRHLSRRHRGPGRGDDRPAAVPQRREGRQLPHAPSCCCPTCSLRAGFRRWWSSAPATPLTAAGRHCRGTRERLKRSWRTAGADRIGSLAAQLVAGGVPVVVGMGGRVADSACRLFTRFFGEALVRGDPLVAAVAHGRNGAFLDGIPDTVDWAFPVLFLDSRALPLRRARRAAAGQPDPGQAPAGRIRAYNVTTLPRLLRPARRSSSATSSSTWRTRRKRCPSSRPYPDGETVRCPGLGRSRVLRSWRRRRCATATSPAW